jgi:hypothetical protein
MHLRLLTQGNNQNDRKGLSGHNVFQRDLDSNITSFNSEHRFQFG